MSENDFYIGYLPKSPENQGRFTRRTVVFLALLVIGIVLILTLGQHKLPVANFEFDHVQKFQGTIDASPYPTLIVARPGMAAAGGDSSRYLLVAPGKHGADDLLRGFDGKKVALDAKLIYRDGQTMLEVMPGSITASAVPATTASPDVDLGNVSLVGEIVDSKCYSGVMNPGSGKVHRDCATRCISGGIPPLFLAKNADGNAEIYELAGSDGRAMGKEVLGMVAEPVTIEGRLVRRGSSLLLYADANHIAPVPAATVRSWSCPRPRSK